MLLGKSIYKGESLHSTELNFLKICGSVRSQIHDSPRSINLPFYRGRRSEEIFISGEDRSRGEREEKWSSKTKEISQARPKKGVWDDIRDCLPPLTLLSPPPPAEKGQKTSSSKLWAQENRREDQPPPSNSPHARRRPPCSFTPSFPEKKVEGGATSKSFAIILALSSSSAPARKRQEEKEERKSVSSLGI